MFEDLFKFEQIVDHFTQISYKAVSVLYKMFIEDEAFKKSDAWNEVYNAEDKTYSEKLLITLLGMDDHFGSKVFRKLGSKLKEEEIGQKSASPVPSIQLTGTNFIKKYSCF